MDDITKQIIELISEQTEVPESEISLESKIIDDLGADSLDVVELMISFEDTFKIPIPQTPPSESMEITVEWIVNFVKDAMNAAEKQTSTD